MGVPRIRLPVSERISIPQSGKTALKTVRLNLNADRNANYALAA